MIVHYTAQHIPKYNATMQTPNIQLHQGWLEPRSWRGVLDTTL